MFCLRWSPKEITRDVVVCSRRWVFQALEAKLRQQSLGFKFFLLKSSCLRQLL
jgi:hypothetical protein